MADVGTFSPDRVTELARKKLAQKRKPWREGAKGPAAAAAGAGAPSVAASPLGRAGRGGVAGPPVRSPPARARAPTRLAARVPQQRAPEPESSDSEDDLLRPGGGRGAAAGAGAGAGAGGDSDSDSGESLLVVARGRQGRASVGDASDSSDSEDEAARPAGGGGGYSQQAAGAFFGLAPSAAAAPAPGPAPTAPEASPGAPGTPPGGSVDPEAFRKSCEEALSAARDVRRTVESLKKSRTRMLQPGSPNKGDWGAGPESAESAIRRLQFEAPGGLGPLHDAVRSGRAAARRAAAVLQGVQEEVSDASRAVHEALAHFELLERHFVSALGGNRQETPAQSDEDALPAGSA